MGLKPEARVPHGVREPVDSSRENPPVPAVKRSSSDAMHQPCPGCGEMMFAVRGSKAAVCTNCGFKDSCCF